MNPVLITSKADVVQQIARCTERIKVCEDVIKQCKGVSPTEFTFTFSVRSLAIVEFGFTDEEREFHISYFISWLQFYRNYLRRLNEVLSTWE